ncbi:DUF2490 domain-containing protein [Flavobacterium hibisci]|uniref:DUF2490 domain-containing protein n=1 Tax=Flavobacterium hibisci TaxID=1914462 RepID=UPI001CBEFF61|nr:DUF2490 domain-containing protein [Flavobacterium hibisci]MBZ4043800.1 DUF2490 domain-containing protein [Flavobacterium hibisci]
MKYLKAYYLLFALILSVNLINAQDTDTGNWFMYFGNQAINKKWNWHNEVQYRNYNFAGDTQQLLLRTGIGYNLTENNNNILLGYGFINSQNYIPGTNDKTGNNEHRIFQQFITRQNFGRIYLQHRYRVEERFLEDDFQMRFRYFLALNVPINKPKMEDKAFYFSAYNEIFINAESPVFDRDRVYGALGYVINKNFRVEAGFMRQIQEKTGRNQFQIAVYNNIPFNSSK